MVVQSSRISRGIISLLAGLLISLSLLQYFEPFHTYTQRCIFIVFSIISTYAVLSTCERILLQKGYELQTLRKVVYLGGFVLAIFLVAGFISSQLIGAALVANLINTQVAIYVWWGLAIILSLVLYSLFFRESTRVLRI